MFLSLDFGLEESICLNHEKRLSIYQKFVYDKGEIDYPQEKGSEHKLSKRDYFRYRCRYFTDSGIIGTKSFVNNCYQSLRPHLAALSMKEPQAIQGLPQIYSLKRLTKAA